MPGSANTLSVTTTPPTMSATPTPMIVTTGRLAFLSAWRISTRAGGNPFAYAVRM
jgi:hypothetical protein